MPYTDKEKEQYLAYYESERNAGRTPKKFGVWLAGRKKKKAYDTLNESAARKKLNQKYTTTNTYGVQNQILNQRALTEDELARYRD